MIIGGYEIVRQIAQGGFGRTYEARHILLDETACLKQNSKITKDDAELLKREAKLMWNVNHYSLPAMRDFLQAGDGSYVLAMQFIEGKELQKAIDKHKSLEPETVCWISQRLLHALYYLHHAGIIHGDVKPGNVIVQPRTHNAVLVDYGLSTFMPKASSSAVGHTALFAAPEVLAGKPPIPASDIYSLGLTMLFALGGDPIAKTFPADVPKKLEEFINEMMLYDPAGRPGWEKADLVKRLSDIRQEAFGRKHTL